uniref:Alkaline ceramidase n=1 Tax=Syphacia muris TaxID=451379 RepID=A0A0N5AWZ9_9BILA
MQRWFEYESGHAWCESAYKYQRLPFVAEFANSVTNLPIIILPMLNVWMIKRYIDTVNWVIVLPHLLLTFNGIASTYYHATLSLFGQLVDELSLLWLLNIGLFAYLPTMKWYPQKYKSHVSSIRFGIVVVTTMISGLCFIKPSLNALALMSYSIPGIIIIYIEGVQSELEFCRRSPATIFLFWIAASICWFADRLFCYVWLYFGIPYLHAVFHLLSSVAAYRVFVMFSLLEIYRQSLNHNYKVKIAYFPRSTTFGLPYISLRVRHS